MSADPAAPRPSEADSSPWHAGELAMQRSSGVGAQKMARIGRRAIRSAMPIQHREFFEQLPFVVIGTVDARGNPWATWRLGRPGFVQAPDARHLVIRGRAETDDPARITEGVAVGVLGIEPHTRRRNRANGRVLSSEGGTVVVAVEQSFGNCPKYIRPRWPEAARELEAPRPPAEQLSTLDEAGRDLVRGADTFFVASYTQSDDGRQHVDVSHRGGPAGFLRVQPDGAIDVPDYAGNNFFNTLGNFVSNPVAGLVFVDFDSGDLLQLSGRVAGIFDGEETGGAEPVARVWRFVPTRAVRRRGVVPWRWSTAG
ncbi:MAG: pyridoxamine 5'-phosphate oxidase family protein [Myxococcota bacterium]